jgi:hypothetical protein
MLPLLVAVFVSLPLPLPHPLPLLVAVFVSLPLPPFLLPLMLLLLTQLPLLPLYLVLVVMVAVHPLVYALHARNLDTDETARNAPCIRATIQRLSLNRKLSVVQ